MVIVNFFCLRIAAGEYSSELQGGTSVVYYAGTTVHVVFSI